MGEQDIRWLQRFSNYNKALDKLSEAVQKVKQDYSWDDGNDISTDHFLDDIIKEGIIQRFEYTYELAWNVMKDYFRFQGNTNITGSKDAIREAFSNRLVTNGELWMEMIQSRIKTSHTYNEEVADAIFQKIMNEYHPAFLRFRETMEKFRSGSQNILFEEE